MSVRARKMRTSGAGAEIAPPRETRGREAFSGIWSNCPNGNGCDSPDRIRKYAQAVPRPMYSEGTLLYTHPTQTHTYIHI